MAHVQKWHFILLVLFDDQEVSAAIKATHFNNAIAIGLFPPPLFVLAVFFKCAASKNVVICSHVYNLMLHRVVMDLVSFLLYFPALLPA